MSDCAEKTVAGSGEANDQFNSFVNESCYSIPIFSRSPVRLFREASFNSAKRYIFSILVAIGFVFPLSAFPQVVSHGESFSSVDRLRWVTSEQLALRVLAIDMGRQQVVIKVGAGEPTVLKRGAAIPTLGVTFVEVAGSTVFFRPVNVQDQRIVERISISLAKGGQVTSMARMAAPARSVVSGWVVGP